MSLNTHLYHIDFEQYKPEALRGLFEAYRDRTRKEIAEFLAKETVTFEDLYGAKNHESTILDEMFFSGLHHLTGAANLPEFRDAYNALIPDMVAFSLEVSQNKEVFKRYLQVQQSPEYDTLNVEQKRVLDLRIQNAKLNGIDLEGEAQEKYSALVTELSQVTTKFNDNSLDSRQAWSHLVTDVAELKGVPENNIAMMAEAAQAAGKEGYLITLDIPIVIAIQNFCEVRETRKLVQQAYAKVASPEDATDGKCDNTAIVNEIYRLKSEIAKVLGFKNVAELSLARKMAESSTEVLDFLYELRDKAIQPAKELLNDIKQFAKDELGIEDFQLWDQSFAVTAYGRKKYNLDPEEVRQYLPENKVVAGLFEIIKRLYGIEFVVDPAVKTYHPDCKFVNVYEDGKLVAGLYMDLYARKGKRSGAWMDEFVGRNLCGNELKLPIAVITCNFNPPVNGKAALLTFDEVVTLFHEMGHALHLLLTKVNVQGICGTNVEWDAVELPSQIFENWCYDKESLDLISAHHETGEPMPEDLINRIIANRQFDDNPIFLLRQLSFGIFDMTLFSRDSSDTRDVQTLWYELTSEMHQQYGGLEPNRYFPNTFGHIFGGGYTAGYYSYLWALVLALDAFQAFKEAGSVFDKTVATKFKNEVLAVGGTYPSMENFVRFRGRKPSVDALLEAYGIK